MSSEIRIIPIRGIPEVRPGDDLGVMITRAAEKMKFKLADGDIVVVAQKIVSKAEGRLVKLCRQTSCTEGFVRDGASNLAVHATATFSMVGGAEKVK